MLVLCQRMCDHLTMRILDVSPRTVFPPRDGAMVRTHHLLRSLSRHHTVRLFSQPRLSEFWGTSYPREIECSGAYPEYRYTNPLSGALIQALRRPHASGLALRLTRPTILQKWFEWADVILVEQPWQYAYCRQRHPDGLLVMAAHNFEKATSASNAPAHARAYSC